MADYIIEDPITEARALAQAALRTDRWHSLQPTVVATVGAVGLVGPSSAFMVTQKAMQWWMVPWTVFGAAIGAFGLFYVAYECRRMFERAKLLEQLVRAIQQYDALIRDARAERDQAKQLVATLTAQNGTLNAAFAALMMQRSAAPGVTEDESA